jgi:hypothetical protein
MPSLVNILRRCHSTVRADRNSRAPISGLVRPSRASPGDVDLLCGQRCDGLDAFARRLAGGGQLPARALDERLHADLGEHVVGRAQLRAGAHAAVLPAQPFTVEQVGAGEFRAHTRPAQPVDRLAVELVGGRRVAQQRPAAGLDAGRDIVVAGLRGLRQPRERVVASSVSPARAAASMSSGSAKMETSGSKGFEVACRAADSASS